MPENFSSSMVKYWIILLLNIFISFLTHPHSDPMHVNFFLLFIPLFCTPLITFNQTRKPFGPKIYSFLPAQPGTRKTLQNTFKKFTAIPLNLSNIFKEIWPTSSCIQEKTLKELEIMHILAPILLASTPLYTKVFSEKSKLFKNHADAIAHNTMQAYLFSLLSSHAYLKEPLKNYLSIKLTKEEEKGKLCKEIQKINLYLQHVLGLQESLENNEIFHLLNTLPSLIEKFYTIKMEQLYLHPFYNILWSNKKYVTKCLVHEKNILDIHALITDTPIIKKEFKKFLKIFYTKSPPYTWKKNILENEEVLLLSLAKSFFNTPLYTSLLWKNHLKTKRAIEKDFPKNSSFLSHRLYHYFIYDIIDASLFKKIQEIDALLSISTQLLTNCFIHEKEINFSIL